MTLQKSIYEWVNVRTISSSNKHINNGNVELGIYSVVYFKHLVGYDDDVCCRFKTRIALWTLNMFIYRAKFMTEKHEITYFFLYHGHLSMYKGRKYRSFINCLYMLSGYLLTTIQFQVHISLKL